MENKPKLIGITGGIGSGKTLVCRVFQVLGISVYFADNRAKLLMKEDNILKKEIINLFGEQAYNNDGILDNKFIASKAFHDNTLLNKLNALVHPAVQKDFNKWVETNKTQHYLLKEAALLIETNSYKALDKLILVTAPKSLKVERVLKRDVHRNAEQIESIMAKQLDDQEKITHANYILENNGKKMLLPQILSIHQQLIT